MHKERVRTVARNKRPKKKGHGERLQSRKVSSGAISAAQGKEVLNKGPVDLKKRGSIEEHAPVGPHGGRQFSPLKR